MTDLKKEESRHKTDTTADATNTRSIFNNKTYPCLKPNCKLKIVLGIYQGLITTDKPRPVHISQ